METKQRAIRLAGAQILFFLLAPHLHRVESKGGVLGDKADLWDHVASSLDERSLLTQGEVEAVTPELEERSTSSLSLSDVISGSNCFIDSCMGKDLQ